LVEEWPTERQQQRTFYPLLLPIALIGVMVWVLQEPGLTVLAYIFVAYCGVVLAVLPKEIAGLGQHPRQWLAVALVLALTGSGVALGVPVGLLLLALLIGLLLRLWYIRQYHRRLGYSQSAELLRKGLLVVLWSSISVLVALYNSY
jgi:ABC-type phosphate/phosphonate transport system permease subunit